jgi:transcription elongation factor GreB
LADKSREAERRLVERDLRYFEARLDTAIVVDRSAGAPDDVRFGAEVDVREEGGLKRYEIVGEDEAEPERGRLSWSSPLARALLGAKPGQDVSWQTPSGESRVTVVSVRY